MIVGTTLIQVHRCSTASSQKPAGGELRRHHQAAAVRERRQHRHREGVDVIERQHRSDAIAAARS